MSQVEKVPVGSPNPLYGCAIFVIILSVMGGIVSWVLYSGLKQNQEIGEFAVDKADPLPVAEVSAEARTALQQKIGAFANDSSAGKEAVLSLGVQELNELIVLAGESNIADYRGMVKFTGFNQAENMLLADLVWPLNRLSFTDKSKRYLVGKAAFKPIIEQGSFDLKIETLDVPGKTVSVGFAKSLGNWPWLNLAKLNPTVAETMKKVTSFQVTSDGTRFELKTTVTAVANPQ